MLEFLKRPRPQARVSVVVPLYNHAAYIEAAINSILEQGSIVSEIIVIDDGSTDDSAAVMRRLAMSDARIIFETQANQGAHATINTALARCSGQFLTILNSDDVYLPGRLTALVAALDKAPDTDIAASAIAFIDGAGKPVENSWYAQAMADLRNAPSMAVALINGNFLMTTSNFLFRRSLFAQVGSFAALRYAHDLDFALRALALGKKILLLDKRLMRYRVHATNTISEDHRRVRSEWAICAATYFTTLLDQPGDNLDWSIAAALEDVLKQHHLTKAVHLIMAYFRRNGTGTLDRNKLLEDTNFLHQLLGWI